MQRAHLSSMRSQCVAPILDCHKVEWRWEVALYMHNMVEFSDLHKKSRDRQVLVATLQCNYIGASRCFDYSTAISILIHANSQISMVSHAIKERFFAWGAQFLSAKFMIIFQAQHIANQDDPTYINQYVCLEDVPTYAVENIRE